ncbi:AraC family transcriptional regulator [bacterium]|nr:AraC family transcriptional regulator [bacterium]
MRKGGKLLENSSLSIIEIALNVGYSDPAYFSKIFRKTVGISPIEYRRLKGRK